MIQLLFVLINFEVSLKWLSNFSVMDLLYLLITNKKIDFMDNPKLKFLLAFPFGLVI